MTIHPGPAPSPEDEQLVRDLLDKAMGDTRPPLDLTASALARGRRLRARRRARLASGAVAACVLAAIAFPSAFGGDGPRTRTSGDLVAVDPPVPAREDQPGWWDMPATEMVSAVRAALPDGVALTAPGPLEADTEEGGPAAGYIVSELTGPDGPGTLNVMLYPDATEPAPGGGHEPDRLSCDEEHSGRTDCVQLRDDQGAVVGRRLTNRWGGTITYEVVLHREGGTVYGAVANTLDRKWGAWSPLSADVPPLTLDQLEELVRDDAWTSYGS